GGRFTGERHGFVRGGHAERRNGRNRNDRTRRGHRRQRRIGSAVDHRTRDRAVAGHGRVDLGLSVSYGCRPKPGPPRPHRALQRCLAFADVSLQLLFWGSSWNSNPSPSIGEVVNAVNSILQGPYLSGLGQYGVGGGSLKGAWIVTGREPNNPFSDDDVHSIISDLIDQGSFPEPDDPGGRNLYMFILPANVHSNNPKHTGEHMYDTDFDLPFDIDKTWFGWVTHNGTLDSLTPIFSHELVEACTDPEGDAVQVNPRNDSDWHEIGDVCCSNARVNGVLVQSYWSDQDLACIIPTALPEISAPSLLEFGPLHLHQPTHPKP